jgi:hypothetical protein
MNKDHVIINDINSKTDVLDSLSLFEDEDFNGNNGIDFCKDETLENGFTSDKDYILNKLKNSNKDNLEIIKEYLDYWLGSYYYEYELIAIDENKQVLSIMYDYE